MADLVIQGFAAGKYYIEKSYRKFGKQREGCIILPFLGFQHSKVPVCSCISCLEAEGQEGREQHTHHKLPEGMLTENAIWHLRLHYRGWCQHSSGMVGCAPVKVHLPVYMPCCKMLRTQLWLYA